MREILTLSLPKQAIQIIKKTVKQRGFPTASSYIKYLLAMDSELISEQELAKDIARSRQDYKKGKVYKLKSLADLI